MDANDVEMTMKRYRWDSDEVYPVENLCEDENAYQPKARRQNRWFAVGIVCFVMAIGALVGAKIYLFPGHVEVEGAGTQQGTVSNNADNANKVSEALRDNKQLPSKKPHSSSWSEGSESGGKAGDQPNEVSWDATANEQKEQEKQEPKEETADKDAVMESEPNKEKENLEQNGNTEDTADSDEQKPEKGSKKKDKLNAWQEIQVTKDDGVMYEILDVLSHDSKSFTEGLTYYNDKLYESVGLKGQSQVLVLDPNTGETLESHTMENKLFGEGLTYAHGKLYQLTYKANRGFIYDIEDLGAPPEEFRYQTTTGEGWGFTYDKNRDEFIVSDGSHFLHFWDRKTLKQVRKHQIMRQNGSKAKRINELEFWRDRVVANVWYEKVLLIINPVSGIVEKEYDFNTIWEVAGETKNKQAEVFNGISVSSDPDVLYVTGKWWSKMFKVKLLPEIPS